MKTFARDFFRIPSPRGHRTPALRVAAGIGIPLVVLVLMGRTDLTIFAVFGALTGVFGRVEPHWLRLKHQTFAGILMSLSIVGGVICGGLGAGGWALVGVGTLIAGGLSIVADALRLRPSGPLFYIFAFMATANVPFDGMLWEAALAGVASVGIALVLGFVGRLWARRIEPDRRLEESPLPPWSRIFAQSGRYAVGVGLAGSIAIASGLGHHYWAMVAACAPIAVADASGGMVRALHRIIGTYGGVLLTAGLLTVDWPPLGLAILLASLQFVGEVFVISHYSLALVFITPMALMMTEFVAPGPTGVLVADRALETTIGAVVAFLVILASTRRQRTRARELRAQPAA
ncbi:FUSC family protein [Brevibacterium marinum]|uniref:Integral membrane bound transporter domain-containing protein n=1 Tax=Brevibacterium marinum TaxID=418643 RepID=A0A846S1E5_9MICO|nr:hypothetical protein [Brevibacterium marinum]